MKKKPPTPKPAKKPARLWLCRDNLGDDSCFVIGVGKKPRRDGWNHNTWSGTHVFCAATFHRVFPNIKLAPGEGPVEIVMQAKRVKGRK